MVMIDFENGHEVPAAWAFERVITEGETDRQPPFRGTKDKLFASRGDGEMKMLCFFIVSGIKAVIPNHLKMFIGYVANDAFDEINGGDFFRNELFIFMAVVVEGNEIAVIVIDS